MNDVYILYHLVEYEASDVVGVYSNFDIAKEAALCYVNRCFAYSPKKYELLEKVQKGDFTNGRDVSIDRGRWLSIRKSTIDHNEWEKK